MLMRSRPRQGGPPAAVQGEQYLAVAAAAADRGRRGGHFWRISLFSKMNLFDQVIVASAAAGY